MAATEDPLDALAIYLKALANPKRLRLMQYLVQPHHLEDIAAELGVTRQSADEHVQQLAELGLLQTQKGRGERGVVTTYVVVPQRLFNVHEMFATLGELEPDLEEHVEQRLATTPDGAPKSTSPREQDLPRLTIVHGMRLGSTLALSGPGPWLIGRDAHAALELDYDPYVSTRHAEIRRAPSGVFELADLYSSNGTSIDWKRLPRGGTERLDNGVVIRVGKTLVIFRTPK